MAQPSRQQGGYDVLTVILSAAAFGLAILPIVLLAGGKSEAVMALAGAYGSVVAVAAPLYAKRRRDDRNGGSDGDSRG